MSTFMVLFDATKKGIREKNETEITKEVSDHEIRLQEMEDYVDGIQIKLDKKKQ